MTGTDTKILDMLFNNGVIDKAKYQSVLQYQRTHDVALEDAIIDAGALDEDTLLKQLAHIYRTRFVATQKLKKAEISRTVLEKIPAKLAMKLNVFPILYRPENSELSVVMSDPSNVMLEQEISHASGVPHIRSFIARPAAIQAAIAKYYRGDIHAFANLDKEGVQAYYNMMDVYQRNVLDEESMVTSLAEEKKHREHVFSLEDMSKGEAQSQRESHVGSDPEMILEILRVLVSLLESTRGDLAGHSVQTSRLIERMGRRINLPKRDMDALEIAGLLHDLGKGSPYHLTPLNVAEWDGHRTAAEKRYNNPAQLFTSIPLPHNTVTALRHMYERYDGKGLPDGLRAKDIPLGARVLALADTYSDLTSNPRNPYRRILTTEEAMKVLKNAKERVFDPNLVDLFAIAVAGDDLKRQLLTGAQTVLVVDSDPEQSAILDLQLTSRGFKVKCAQTADMALKTIKEAEPNIIVSEVDLDTVDGFELKKRLNQGEETQTIPFIYFTTRAASADVQKGFKLGASDYLVKPSSVDIITAKIHKTLEEKPGTAAGVSGSLSEMSLPDLVQILAHGRKSGQLKLKMGQHKGEIHFMNGDIYNALFERTRGEEAFFQMLRFRDGTFSLNPNFKAESKVIQMTAEMLLLEGMRRLDEESR